MHECVAFYFHWSMLYVITLDELGLQGLSQKITLGQEVNYKFFGRECNFTSIVSCNFYKILRV